MKKSVKTLVLITTSFLIFGYARAQLKLLPGGGIGSDIKKVVTAYPNHFSSITGDQIEEDLQSASYECTFNAAGAEKTTISRYSAKANNVYSWQALMLTSEDFDKARQKFRALYNQLNNLSVSTGPSAGGNLQGTYESPAEEKKFTSVVFSIKTGDETLRKVKVELSIEFYEPMEWRVKVLVYDREREDNERGREKE